ncbi:hypothetical protein RSSM_00369 [Rhodopirellula sallentina SM41]|uniref:Uncharacterized protein n=1 Tax=Rhodopirellula sallentina SM41 TaxID=1263870 RepID=M5UQF1_9BACT|nr:hypothetical protein RSSM_00369 [Rhodopirellula sallentina SM41]
MPIVGGLDGNNRDRSDRACRVSANRAKLDSLCLLLLLDRFVLYSIALLSNFRCFNPPIRTVPVSAE